MFLLAKIVTDTSFDHVEFKTQITVHYANGLPISCRAFWWWPLHGMRTIRFSKHKTKKKDTIRLSDEYLSRCTQTMSSWVGLRDPSRNYFCALRFRLTRRGSLQYMRRGTAGQQLVTDKFVVFILRNAASEAGTILRLSCYHHHCLISGWHVT